MAKLLEPQAPITSKHSVCEVPGARWKFTVATLLTVETIVAEGYRGNIRRNVATVSNVSTVDLALQNVSTVPRPAYRGNVPRKVYRGNIPPPGDRPTYRGL